MDNIYVRVRKKYGMSRLSMSRILGFGDNQWRKYEEELIEPKDSHALLIGLIMDPESFKGLLIKNEVVLKRELGERKYGRLRDRIEVLLKEYSESEATSYKKWVGGLYD